MATSKPTALKFSLWLVLLALASVLLYFGLGMLLLVPGSPGESYWARARVLYGLIPLLGGIITAALSGRIVVSRPEPGELVRSLCRHCLYALFGVPLVFGFLCLNDLWFHIPIPHLP